MSSSRPITPASGLYSNMNDPRDSSLASRPQYSSEKPNSYINSAASGTGFEHVQGAPQHSSVLAQSVNQQDDSFIGGASSDAPELNRADSAMSQSNPYTPSRQGTLKKKASLKRTGSMKRNLSRKSSQAGSVRSLNLGEKEKYEENVDHNSAFYCPVPTSGNPTEALADRFQAWRKILKDLINYFRDIQKSYEARSKSLLSASNILNNITIPSNFMNNGGVGDATNILRDFHKQSLTEANKSRDVENEVIMQLTGLRSDLQQKIKEIKSLSGDFKNSVGKEQGNTKQVISQFQEAIGMVDKDVASTSGRGDPFIVKLGVDRQLGRQIEEENYLHRAYLNLESSGRELESIVVGEIQKAYNAYASILQREANESFDAAEKLKEGPLAIAKDHEWDNFVTTSPQMVDPRTPVRSFGNITYAGKDHPAAIDVKSGMLERKSKYLKNYTPGWYILSPTHLHEFKSADRISSQTPVMSLYLPEQKLGSHSEPGSSSHKFMLKGRQTGSMHRGHAWVFRAESHDTMMAWFQDIKELTEKTGEERNAFIRRQHARSLSGQQKPLSIGSGNSIMQEDEADRVPYSSEQSIRGQSVPREGAEGGLLVAGAGLGPSAIDDVVDDSRSEAGWRPPQRRPSPGGRFPSEVDVNRGLRAPMSPSSGESELMDRDAVAGAAAMPGSAIPFATSTEPNISQREGVGATTTPPASSNYTPGQHPHLFQQGAGAVQHDGASGSQYSEWMAPVAAGAGVAALGAGAVHHHYEKANGNAEPEPGRAIPVIDDVNSQMENSSAVPAHGISSGPIPIAAADDLEIQERSLSRPRGLTESTQATTMMHGTSVGGASLSTVPTSVTGMTEDTEKLAPITAAAATETGLFDANGTYVGPRSANADSAKPTDFVVRPSLGDGNRAKSVQTISDLHIPGEFPSAVSVVGSEAASAI